MERELMASRIVVEWTRASLRVAVAEGGGGRWRLRAVHSQPLAAPAAAGESLRALLKTARMAGASVIGVLPREQVITRLVKLPSTDPGEVGPMVELYAKAQLPYPRAQTVVDFHVLRQEEGFSTVAVIACQRELVDRHLAVLREAGLEPALLTLSSWGVLGWYRRLQRSAERPAIEEPALVINVDDARTDLVLVRRERLLLSRSVGQGAADWADAGEAVELLALEVERSRAAIQKDLPDVEMRSLVLTGMGELPAWSEQLAQRLGLPSSVVEGRRPLQGWVGPMTTPISTVVVGGLACGPDGRVLNLNPPEIRQQARHRRQVRELSAVGALTVGVLVLGACGLALQGFRHRRHAVRLEQALGQVEPAARAVQEQTRSVQLVAELLDKRRRFAETLAGVFGATPATITLESLAFDGPRRELLLRGTAGSTQAVLDYIAQLERLEGVDAVQLKYATQRAGAGGGRADFELIMSQEQPS
jgi:Tfp pilus assembly protein PilN